MCCYLRQVLDCCYVTNQVANLEEGPVGLDTSPSNPMRVFLILVWLRLDHILLQVWLFFFPSFSFFVTVSEGGGGVRGGGERNEGKGRRGRRAKS